MLLQDIKGCLTRYNGGGQKWYELLGFPFSTLHVASADIFLRRFFICTKLFNDIYHELFSVFLNGIEWLILFPMYECHYLSKTRAGVSQAVLDRVAHSYTVLPTPCTVHTHVMHDRALHSTLFYV